MKTTIALIATTIALASTPFANAQVASEAKKAGAAGVNAAGGSAKDSAMNYGMEKPKSDKMAADAKKAGVAGATAAGNSAKDSAVNATTGAATGALTKGK